jgi:hypothetical protein
MSFLFCFDFDQTISNEHLFNPLFYLSRSGMARENLINHGVALMQKYGVKGGDLFWEIISKILQSEHQIAIVTFSAYPDFIRATMLEGLQKLRNFGCTPEHIRKWRQSVIAYGDVAPQYAPLNAPEYCVHIRSADGWKPELGKSLHIQQAKQIYERANHKFFDKIFLIDDDPYNIEMAKKNHDMGILVPQEANAQIHLMALKTLLI